jgi:hypothetical protein
MLPKMSKSPKRPRRAPASLAIAEPVARKAKKAPARKAKATARPTKDERELAALLQKHLRHLGLDRARVVAVAMKAGQGADLRFEGIPASKVDLLKKGIT